ncbi:MAG: ATP-binding protein, partial [Romboutsia sp.]|nr:ATP-binding protein [Romboutsia sp.]
VEQLQKLIEHIKIIIQSYKNLEVVNADIVEYKAKLIDSTAVLNDQANFAINQTESFLQTIKQEFTEWTAKDLEALEKLINKHYKAIEVHKTKYSFTELDINTLEQCDIASGVAEGELLVKTIDFKEEISAWLEAEIYPVFYDLKNLSEQIHDRCLLSLINVNNRVKEIVQQIKLKENLPYNMETVLQPISNIPKNANKILVDLVAKNEDLAKTINETFKTTNIFNNNDYFIYRVNLNREANGKIVKYKFGFWERNYQKFKRSLRKYFYKDDDTVLNLLDTFDFIQHNTIQQQDIATTSLFLKKGYIGKSFLVERNDVYQLTKVAIKEWNAGNKGALLVYGDALTGKSTILESINLAIPKLPVVYLKPHTTIHYKGRNFEVEYNLEEALKFINKYIYQDKVILAIDDLELWRDKQNSLYDNINTFIYNINKYNKNIFFIVSTNGWMKHHLDTYFRFNDYFIAEYCTNFTSNDDILKAIVLRYIGSI